LYKSNLNIPLEAHDCCITRSAEITRHTVLIADMMNLMSFLYCELAYILDVLALMYMRPPPEIEKMKRERERERKESGGYIGGMSKTPCNYICSLYHVYNVITPA
jgi:hypothetical protein